LAVYLRRGSSLMDDPTPELEAEAMRLRQRVWILGEMYKACRANGLPDHMTDQVVMDWYTSQIEGQVVWTDLNEE
jgi:hypothetical protein